MPLFGSVKPTASKSAKRPFASPSPRKSPTTDARTPITSASSMTERSTCRRDAPSVRSVANSRVRCAIVIESELTITNAPTKSAIAAKASRKYWRKRDELVRCPSRPRCACGVAGRAPRCPAAGSRGSASTSCCGETPGFAATRISSSLPCLVEEPLRGRRGRSRRASRRRSSSTAPNLTMPEIRSCSTGPSTCTPIVSPTAKSFLSAVDRRRRPRPARGQAALDERQRVELRLASGRRRSRGSARRRRRSPCRPCRSAALSLDDAADRVARRPAAPAPPASSDSSNGGLRRSVVARASNADLPVIDRVGARGRRRVKIASNALSIESVRTNVPLTIATPRTIAIAVSAVRSFRASRPLSANAVICAAISSIASPISCCERAGELADDARRRRGRGRGRRSPPRAPRA